MDRPRRRTALTLIVIASVIGFLAIFALWANRQLLDTDNWTETSSELLENDEIRGQVAGFLTDELYANVDVEARLRQVLPPQAAPLAGPAAGGLKQLAERAAKALLGAPSAPEAVGGGQPPRPPAAACACSRAAGTPSPRPTAR